MILNTVPFVVGSILMSTAKHMVPMVIGRVLVGINVEVPEVGSVVTNVFLSEVSPVSVEVLGLSTGFWSVLVRCFLFL